ncbi:MAG: hypothetical protein E7269_08565 [Lachnospiraceae bacterium]|nr:hypothetical protein [Lachnospiraceae bacterium]
MKKKLRTKRVRFTGIAIRFFTMCIVLTLTLSLSACMKNKPRDENSTTKSEQPPVTTGPEENGNPRLLQHLAADTKVGEAYVFDVNVLCYDNEQVLVQYTLSNRSMNSMEAGLDIIVLEHHFALYSREDMRLIKEIVADDTNTYFEQLREAICLTTIGEDGYVLETYDYELNQIAEVSIGSGSLGYFSPDGKRCYYDEQKKIYVYDSADDSVEELEGDGNYLVNSINGVITDEAGNDFVIFQALAADYRDYQFIVNATSGEIIRVDAMEERYTTISNNTYVEYKGDGVTENEWLAGVSQDVAFAYEWDVDNYSLSLLPMRNRNLLFTYGMDDTLYLYLYEYETGQLLGEMSLDTSKMKAQEEVYEEYDGEMSWGTQVFLYGTPVLRDADTMLLQLANYAGDVYFMEWDFTVDGQQNVTSGHVGKPTVAAHKMGTLPTVDITNLENPLYQPDELSAELLPLRAEADAMEEKYGVEIYIGEECANILGGYAVEPLTDYAMVEGALTTLDAEMSKYPDNFFEQFEYSWVEGLDIYLAASLTGIEEDVLDTAGGFKTVNNYRLLLVMDCQDTWGMPSTFHHELCHAIEEKIVDASYYVDDPLFSETAWDAFNPYEDIYTYTYADWGYEKYYDLAYDSVYYSDGDVCETYFVDTYAMTYPTEDRARLFESVMSDNLYDIDFDAAPHLKEKLNYYAQCIRQTFDTTGWEDVPWEAYLE